MSDARTRGRPKVPWDPFEEELLRRLHAGLSEPTVEAEARYLEEWGKAQNLCVPSGAPIVAARIRERIKKRLNGSQGYKDSRDHWRIKLGLDVPI